MAKQTVREEVDRAVAIYREITGYAPRGFGAPGWQVSAASLEALDEVGFAYASDTRGFGPFFPRIAGKKLHTLQLPTNFPTLDEVLGPDDPAGQGFMRQVRRKIHGRTWSVLTIHAEMEGIGFQDVVHGLLAGLGEEGVTCLPLECLAQEIRAEDGDRIPVAGIVARPIRGRAGTVAMPVGFEVA